MYVLYMLPALAHGPGRQPSRQESSLIVGFGRGRWNFRDLGPDCMRSSMIHNPSMVSLVVNAMVTRSVDHDGESRYGIVRHEAGAYAKELARARAQPPMACHAIPCGLMADDR